MELGRRKREWPSIYLSEARGSMTVADVVAVPGGPERDIAIDDWCRSVWTAFGGNRQTIIALLQEYHLVLGHATGSRIEVDGLSRKHRLSTTGAAPTAGNGPPLDGPGGVANQSVPQSRPEFTLASM